jgi:hypothetical protein
MSNFTNIRRIFSQGISRHASARRRAKAPIGLEALERRAFLNGAWSAAVVTAVNPQPLPPLPTPIVQQSGPEAATVMKIELES